MATTDADDATTGRYSQFYLDGIRERAHAASDGPWMAGAEIDGVYHGRRTVVRQYRGDGSRSRIVSVGQTRPHLDTDAEANVAFIANARQDIPWLLDVVDELLTKLAAAEAR